DRVSDGGEARPAAVPGDRRRCARHWRRRGRDAGAGVRRGIPRLAMHLTIVGATGGIGRQLLEQAVEAGQQVTAVVRTPDALARRVRAFSVDLANGDSPSLRSAIAGADAILSGLGARSAADVGVAARGTRAIAEAMRAVGVNRIIVVSAAPIGTVASPGPPNPPPHHPAHP